MLVCDLCGSRDIRQEATIMLNPNEEIQATKIDPWKDFFWCDYYLCFACNEECQPIEDPHNKEKKDGISDL